MDDALVSSLKEYGLSEKEAKIYLVTLELGSAPASTIGRRAGIKRVTAYALLQDLQRRQIVQSIEKGGVTNFQVIAPEILAKKLEEKHTQFKSALPALAALADQYHNKPRIQYFEGVNGLKELYEDLLSSSEPICAFLGTQVIAPELSDYLYNEFLPQRVEKGIKAKVILGATPENKKYAALDKKNLKQSKIIDNDLFDMESEINLYGPNKVAIALFSGDEMSGFIIHSARLYKSLMSIFTILRQTK